MNQIPDSLSSLISQTPEHRSSGCQHYRQYDMTRTRDPLSGGGLYWPRQSNPWPYVSRDVSIIHLSIWFEPLNLCQRGPLLSSQSLTICQRGVSSIIHNTIGFEPLNLCQRGPILSSQIPDHMSAGCQQHYTQYNRIRTPEPLSEVAFTVQSNSMTTRQLEVFFASITWRCCEKEHKCMFLCCIFCPADLPGQCQDNRGDG